MPARVRTCRAGERNCGRRWRSPRYHLSLYQLTIEPATRFEVLHRQGKIVLPDEDTAAALYDTTADDMRPGRPCCRTKSPIMLGRERKVVTTSRTGDIIDYAGIGPGAHGRITVNGTLHADAAVHRAPEPWAERVERDGDGLTADDPVVAAEDARAARRLLMGLRLTEGIDLTRFVGFRTGRTLAQSVDIRRVGCSVSRRTTSCFRPAG